MSVQQCHEQLPSNMLHFGVGTIAEWAECDVLLKDT